MCPKLTSLTKKKKKIFFHLKKCLGFNSKIKKKKRAPLDTETKRRDDWRVRLLGTNGENFGKHALESPLLESASCVTGAIRNRIWAGFCQSGIRQKHVPSIRANLRLLFEKKGGQVYVRASISICRVSNRNNSS